MSTITLAEVKKLTQDDLVIGVAEDIITVNPIWSVMPFTPFKGNSLSVNRENALGNAQYLDIGDTITAKAPGTRTTVNHEPTTVLGDAEINNLLQAMAILIALYITHAFKTTDFDPNGFATRPYRSSLYHFPFVRLCCGYVLIGGPGLPGRWDIIIMRVLMIYQQA